MADGLSLAAIIAVLQLSDRVITLCGKFVEHVMDAKEQATQTIRTLKGVLEFLRALANKDDNTSQLTRLVSICSAEGPLDVCASLLKRIESRMEMKRDHHGVLKTISWPFNWKDIVEILNDIERQKTSMMLTMQGDMAQATLAIEHRLEDIDTYTKGQIHQEILKWLTKVDPVSNHTAKHECGTGEWFILSRQYSFWMLPGRSLWLHGIPGAGKTVLSSTIIEDIKSRSYPPISCLYYYFDFSDMQKQKAVNMLYSFLAQLSATAVPSEVQLLFQQCGHGTHEVTVTQLNETLLRVARRMTSQNSPIYIVVDALDECSDRDALLEIIEVISSSKQISLLVTSRKENDINQKLMGLIDFIVPIEDERVNTDIELHVRQYVARDTRLEDSLKSTIIETLTSKAHGM
jgi:Cdc6-like AAA superfamily ATPase